MPNYIKFNSTMALFTDDFELYKGVRNPADSERLQNDFPQLKCRFNKWNMTFNTLRCKVLNISKKVDKIQRSNVLNWSAILETVPQITDLGLMVTNNFSWNKHIDLITLYGNR